MPRHPGRVDRVDVVSWRESPDLAGSVPCPYHLKEEDEDEAGRMSDRRGAALLFAGCCSLAMWWRGVAIASPRIGRCGRPSLSLSADTSGRSGERLAMVWTVKTSDGTEERRGTGEDGGGILRPVSLFLFCSLVCSFPALLAFVLSLYIIRYRYNKDNATN